MAGREVSGPEAAMADLFVGRRWAVCPHPGALPDAVAAVSALAVACGALPVMTDPAEHDAAVALTSHLPHVTSVALAGMLRPPVDLSLAGPGLTDMTRLAAGDSSLWRQVLDINAPLLAPLVERLGSDLLGLAGILRALEIGATGDESSRATPGSRELQDAREALEAFLSAGRSGRQLLPGKRGLQDEGFLSISVTVRDEPGQLVGVLQCAADAGVNVEDVRVEHLPGRPTGRLVLWVSRADEARLRRALTDGDSTSHSVENGRFEIDL